MLVKYVVNVKVQLSSEQYLYSVGQNLLVTFSEITWQHKNLVCSQSFIYSPTDAPVTYLKDIKIQNKFTLK